MIKACEGLLLCSSLPEDTAAHIIADYTRLSHVLATLLARLYSLIPRCIHHADIDSTEAKWGWALTVKSFKKCLICTCQNVTSAAEDLGFTIKHIHQFAVKQFHLFFYTNTKHCVICVTAWTSTVTGRTCIGLWESVN